MRALIVGIAAVLLVSSCATDGEEQAEPTDAEEAVEATVRSSIEAENDKDADAFLALWTDEGLSEYDVGSREDVKEGESENWGRDAAEIVGFSGTKVTDSSATTTVDVTLGEHHGAIAMPVQRVKFELIERQGEWRLNGFEFIGGAPPAAGAEVVDIRGQEYTFVLERDEVPGDVAFKFANAGKEPHEITLFKGPDDLTIDQAAENLVEAGGEDAHEAPKGYEVAHLAFAEPGKTVDVSFADSLEGGTYVLACYVPRGGFPEEGEPDPNAKSHFELGMRTLLTVE